MDWVKYWARSFKERFGSPPVPAQRFAVEDFIRQAKAQGYNLTFELPPTEGVRNVYVISEGDPCLVCGGHVFVMARALGVSLKIGVCQTCYRSYALRPETQEHGQGGQES